MQGYGNVSVSAFVDKAHIHKDLKFEYVEDPTITKLEPEWSIFRYVYYKACHYGHYIVNVNTLLIILIKKYYIKFILLK